MSEQIVCSFRFLCDKKWDEFHKIEGNERTRFCSVCEKPVYLTSSYEELAINVAARRCVAISALSSIKDELSDASMLIGDVGPEAFSPPVIDPIFEGPLRDLKISQEIEKKLMNLGIESIGDLVHLSKAEILLSNLLTDHELDRVEEALGLRHLGFEMSVENWAEHIRLSTKRRGYPGPSRPL